MGCIAFVYYWQILMDIDSRFALSISVRTIYLIRSLWAVAGCSQRVSAARICRPWQAMASMASPRLSSPSEPHAASEFCTTKYQKLKQQRMLLLDRARLGGTCPPRNAKVFFIVNCLKLLEDMEEIPRSLVQHFHLPHNDIKLPHTWTKLIIVKRPLQRRPPTPSLWPYGRRSLSSLLWSIWHKHQVRKNGTWRWTSWTLDVDHHHANSCDGETLPPG